MRGARLPGRLGLARLRPRPGEVCGHRLPEGLREADRLPEPIFTPATKATEGHDENITREQAAELVGADVLARLERSRSTSTRAPPRTARRAGLILADTKFELGLDADGTLVLGDEAVTPDSSRLWPADRWRPGQSPPSFDKQYLRDWLDSIGWDHASPPPELPRRGRRGDARALSSRPTSASRR